VIPVDLLREWLRHRARVEQRRTDAVVKEVLSELSREPTSAAEPRGLG
jgi:hypothetical protein